MHENGSMYIRVRLWLALASSAMPRRQWLFRSGRKTGGRACAGACHCVLYCNSAGMCTSIHVSMLHNNAFAARAEFCLRSRVNSARLLQQTIIHGPYHGEMSLQKHSETHALLKRSMFHGRTVDCSQLIHRREDGNTPAPDTTVAGKKRGKFLPASR